MVAQSATTVSAGARAAATRPQVVVISGGIGGRFGEVGEREILERAGCEVIVVNAGDEETALAAARKADGIIMPPRASRRFMESLQCCKVIACSSIGMDRVEGIDLATEKGIVLCNVPDVFVDEVANHAIALLLACVRWIVPAARYCRDGNWGKPGVPRPMGMVHRITGETLGLVGFGNIARAVARRAAGFGLNVMAYDPYLPRDVFLEHGVRQVTMAQVLQDSDFVSLHVPLIPSTHHLIGAAQLALMKRDAIMINTCRGGVVDEPALIGALQNDQILGAGLDVTEQEPVDPHNPLLQMHNVIVTPHVASVSDWAGAERRRRPAYEVVAVLTGHRPRAVLNPTVLEKLALK